MIRGQHALNFNLLQCRLFQLIQKRFASHDYQIERKVTFEREGAIVAT